MRQPDLSYATSALGIIFLAIGLYMHFAIHYRGKAYAVLALGLLVLFTGLALLARTTRKPSSESSSKTFR